MSGLIYSLGEAGVEAQMRYELESSVYRRAHGRLGRIRLRSRMYIVYPLRLFLRCRFNKGSANLVVCSNTFYAPLVASFAQRRAKVIHLVYDLYPDALFAAGLIPQDSASARLCDFLVSRTFRSATANVFLGQRLCSHAESRFGKIPRAYVIPVGADGTPFANHPPASPGNDGPLEILYCGNCGRLHDVDTLIAALREGDFRPGREVKLSFHASGPKFPQIRDLSRSVVSRPVVLSVGPYLEGLEWVEKMRKAHIALVTMCPGAEKVLMPSKTYSALVAGQAIIAICPRQSDLADTIVEHDCGWIVEPGDSRALRDVLEEIRSNPGDLQRKRENAFRVGHSKFSSTAIAAKWRTLFEETLRGAPARVIDPGQSE
jgi:glycosyltransferase involved in cell wall biosynthesis